jgi:hypothetical protein
LSVARGSAARIVNTIVLVRDRITESESYRVDREMRAHFNSAASDVYSTVQYGTIAIVLARQWVVALRGGRWVGEREERNGDQVPKGYKGGRLRRCRDGMVRGHPTKWSPKSVHRLALEYLRLNLPVCQLVPARQGQRGVKWLRGGTPTSDSDTPQQPQQCQRNPWEL